MRLIDAEELLKKVDAIPPRNGDLEEYCDTDTAWLAGITDVMSYISSAPTVDAKPIRHGHWESVFDNRGHHQICPYCGEWRYHSKQRYCGYCGAKMDEVTE